MNFPYQSRMLGVFVWLWAITVLQLFGCKAYHVKEPAEFIEPAGYLLYAGDPQYEAVSRSQASERLKCSDPEFDNFICMRADEFQRLVKEIVAARGASP